jgi:hypothetical protein
LAFTVKGKVKMNKNKIQNKMTGKLKGRIGLILAAMLMLTTLIPAGAFAGGNEQLEDSSGGGQSSVVPQEELSSDESPSEQKANNNKIKTQVSADFILSDFEISGSVVKGFTQPGLNKLADNPGANLTLPSITGGSVAASAFRGKNLGGTLTVPAGYTSVGDQAFQNCGFTAAVLPSSLNSIGEYAFSGNKLTSANLSETSLTNINSHAFAGNKLETLTLSTAVTNIKAGAFEGNNIKTVTLPGVKTIESSAFANNALTEVNLPAATAIAEDAYNGNGRVVKITTTAQSLSSHFTSGNGYIVNPVTILVSYVDGDGEKIRSDKIIGEDFSGADLYTSGTSLTIDAPTISGYNADKPDSKTVTAAPNLTVTFTYSKNVSAPVINVDNRLILKDSTAIDEQTLLSWVSAKSGFDGSAITDIKVSPNSVATDIEQDITVTYTATDDYGNKGQKSITVTIAASFEDKYIGNDWQYKDFTYGGTGNLQVTGFSQLGKDKYDDGNTELILPGYNPYTLSQITSIGTFTGYTSQLTSIDFSQVTGLTTIPTTFQSVSTLLRVNLSNLSKITSIPAYAFQTAPLTELRLDNLPSLKTIGSGSFYAAQLTELDLSGMPNLEQILTDGGGNGAFQNSPLTKLDLSGLEQLKRIERSTFYSAQLTELDLSGLKALTALGHSAFGNANKLTKLNLSGLTKLEIIDNSAFRNAPLTELRLDNLPSLKTIGSASFYAAQLTELDLSGMPNLEQILTDGGGIGAFQNSPLTKLDLSGLASLKYIDRNTFISAQLTELDLSTNVSLQTIGNDAFYSSPLNSLDLSNQTQMVSIGQSSFYSSYINSLVIGGFAPRDNKYIYNANPGSNSVITNNNRTLPISIINNDTGIISGYGYVVNPVTLTVHYIDKDSRLPIWPDRKITNLSAPLSDYTVTAPAIYGYEINPVTTTVNIAVQPGLLTAQEEEVTFEYTQLPVSPSPYELIQTNKHVFDVIGNQLSSYVRLNNTSSDSLVGYKIEVSYDPSKIKPIGVTGATGASASIATPGVVIITRSASLANGTFEAGILWSLIPGPTEEHLDQPLHAQLIDTNGVAVGAANVIGLSGYYSVKPYITKAANGETHDGRVTWSGEKDEDTGLYVDNNVTQKYTFGIGNLKRNISEITFTDILPTYEAVVSPGVHETKTAIFNIAKNPGWTLLGNTVTYKYVNLNTTLASTPRLILDFPDAMPDQNVTNMVSFTAEPYGKAGGEVTFSGTDGITTAFIVKANAPSGISVNKSISMPHSAYNQAWFYDTNKDRNTEFRWAVGVIGNGYSEGNLGANRLPEGDYYKDIVLTDRGLDDRMKFTGVDLDVYAPAQVTAYAAGGDVLFGSPLQSGVVRFPEAIQESISEIVVSDSSATVKSGEAKYVYFLSALKDPAGISYESESAKGDAAKKFWNEGGVLSRTLRSVETTESGSQYISTELGEQCVTDDVEIREMNQGIGIEKNITAETKHTNTISGYPLNYNLALSFYNGDTQTSNEGFDAVLNNVRIVDVLPEYYDMSEFTPEEGLILGSTNLNYRFISDGYFDGNRTYDTFEITADTLDIGKVSKLGCLDGTVSYLVPDDNDIVNNIYLDFDTNPEVALKGSVTTADDNPLYAVGKSIPRSSDSINAMASSEFIPLKSIRVMQADGSWGPWSSAGVSTPLGSTFQYRLLLQNNQQTEREDVSIVDVLPSEGDAQIVASGLRKPRGSGFANALGSVSAVNAPAGYTAYYLTETLPSSYATSADDYFDTANWQSSITEGELASVSAIRITADAGTKLPAHTGLEVFVTMKAPANITENNALAGMRGYNSFARKDNLSASYAEANTVYNAIPEKPAYITLTKRANVAGGAPLSGATFGLYNADGQLLKTAVSADSGGTVGSATTHPAITLGQIAFEVPERGDYEIREISAPAGFILNETTYTVKTADFTDTGHTGYYQKDLGNNVVNIAEPVYGNLLLKKVNAGNSPLPGINFRITPATGLAFNKTTDANGEILLSNVLVGSYAIAEQSGAPGKLEKISFSVTVDETFVSNPTGISPAAAGSLVTKSGEKAITVKNAIASLDIAKIGVYDSLVDAKPVTELQPSDGKALSGVEFQLVDGANPEITIGAPVTTGSSGRTSLSGLEVGRLYGLKEISALPEYMQLTEPVLFKINNDGRVTDEGGTVYNAGLLMVKNIPNEYTGTLTVIKTDNATGDPLGGVSFEVFKQDAISHIYFPYIVGGSPAELITNAAGTATLTDIPYGQYRVTEKPGYAGYFTNTDEQYFSVQRYYSPAIEQDNTSELYFSNVSIAPQAIIKGDYVGTYDLSVAEDVTALTSAEDYLMNTEGIAAQNLHRIPIEDGSVTLLAGLSGAQFDIKEYEGMSADANKFIAGWSVTSKADGSMDVPAGLAFKEGNTYTFKETVAPEGYTLNSTTYFYQPKSERESIIRNGGKWLVFENRVNDHKLVLTKYAGDTQLPLSDVEFELYHSDGVLAVNDVLKTDSNGRIVVNNLTPGTYYLKETGTQEGYLFPEGYYRIVIDGSKDAVPAAPQAIEDTIGEDEGNVIFDTTGGTGDIFKVIYNTPESGVDTLTVSKRLEGDLVSDAEFDFLVQFEGTPYYGPYTLYGFAGDVIGTSKFTIDGHIVIRANQHITVFGRSADEEFTVTEKEYLHYDPSYTIDGHRTDAQGIDGVINGNVTVAVTNADSLVHSVRFTSTAGGSLSGKTEYEAKSGCLWSKSGITVPTPVPENKHYSFTGWTQAIPDGSLAITKNLIYTANFVIDSHTVTYHGSGHTAGIEPSQTTHQHGSAGVKAKGSETLKKDGYVFLGWSLDPKAKTVTYKAGATLNVESDVDLYAVWGKDKPTPPPVEPKTPVVVTDPDPVIQPPGPVVTVSVPVPEPEPEPEAETVPEVGPGTGTNVAAEPEPAEANAVGAPEAMTPQQKLVSVAKAQGIPTLGIGKSGVPLFSPEGIDSWSLLDLMLAIAGAILAIGTLIAASRRRKNDKDDETYFEETGEYREDQKRSRKIFLAGSIIASIVSIILFILTQDMRLPMVFIDIWTIVFALILAVEILFSKLTFPKKKAGEEYENRGEVA